MSHICPKPYSPTETTELDPRSCVSFTVEGATREIAKINCACVALSREIKPCESFLDNAYRRLAALNKQRHTLDLFIFQEKLRKIPQGLSGLLSVPQLSTQEDFADWLSTLSPQELEAFRLYLEKKKEEER